MNPVRVRVCSQQAYPVLISSTAGAHGLQPDVRITRDGAKRAVSCRGAYAPTLFANGQLKTTTPYSDLGLPCDCGGAGTGWNVALDQMYIDGREVATYARHGISAGRRRAATCSSGSSNAGPWATSGFNGTAYRMITYPTMLGDGDVADGERGDVRNEVANRGVSTAPVAVSLITPQLHAVGDSITYGYRGDAVAFAAVVDQPAALYGDKLGYYGGHGAAVAVGVSRIGWRRSARALQGRRWRWRCGDE